MNRNSISDNAIPTMYVSSNDNEYKIYIIELEDINTNNFEKIFDGLNILALYPEINPIYKDRLITSYMYRDIYTFKENYLEELKSKGCYTDINKYITKPIDIEKVLINTSKNELISKLTNFSISKCIDKNFDCIKLEFN